MGRVTSEYGRLTRVLVGRADGFRLPAHEHEPLLEERNVHGSYKLVGRPYPKDVIETANASLDELCCRLREWQPSIDIVRSDMTSEKNHTEMAGNRGYSTRDVMVVVHDTLYLCPTLHQSRSTEAEDCFPHVIDEFAKRGKVVDLRTRRWRELCDDDGSSLRAKSEATERAFLADLRAQAAAADAACGGSRVCCDCANCDGACDAVIASACGRGEESDGYPTLASPTYFSDRLPAENAFEITEEVPIFDAANLLVVNDRQLLYLPSISGNYHGLLQLKQVMRERHGMEVLPVSRVYSGLHIDSTICLLNAEKLLYCAERISLDEANRVLKHCGYADRAGYIPVYKSDMHDVGLFSPDQNFASVYIGMNVLAVDEQTVVVEAKQAALIAKLEAHGFRCIMVPYPHMRTMGGGVHCTTLPLARD